MKHHGQIASEFHDLSDDQCILILFDEIDTGRDSRPL